MSNEFSPISLDDVCHLLHDEDHFLFILHQKPDGDTVGSSAGLVRLVRSMGKEAHLTCVDRIPDRLEFLVEPDEVIYPPFSGKKTVVSVDVASPSQLGRLEKELQGPLTPRMMIDHHEVGTHFADFYVEPHTAATGEIVFRIAKRMRELGMISGIPQGTVEASFAALSSDTGCFRFSNAGPDAFRAAAEMMEEVPEMDTAEINHLLFDSKTPSTLRAEAFSGANLETCMDGKVAYLTVSAQDRADFDLNEEDFESSIDIVRSLKGVEVAFTLKENREGKFKASLRSVGLNVAHVAASFGGGGHERAAGCAVPGATLDEALDHLLNKIKEEMQ